LIFAGPSSDSQYLLGLIGGVFRFFRGELLEGRDGGPAELWKILEFA
jgi:hypothetical protein